MKESKFMLLQYITGAGILVLGAAHFALLTLPSGGLPTALEYGTVKSIYLAYGLVFELFLVLLSFHIFNGFRKVLIELYQGKTYETAVAWLMLLGGGATFVWGTRTILIFLEVLH
jgi:succinate dehydrogenase / fumarate reductase membrane anchor subunit